jgi:hypothetical protein
LTYPTLLKRCALRATAGQSDRNLRRDARSIGGVRPNLMFALNANDPLFREPCLLHLSGLVKAGHWFPAKENRSDRSATAKARPDVESAYPEISDRALPPEAFPPYCMVSFTGIGCSVG